MTSFEINNIKAMLIGFIAIFKYSARKLLLSRRSIIAILIALLVAAIMGYGGTQDVNSLAWGSTIIDILVLSFFMPITAMIFGASMIRDEIEDKSITGILTAPLDKTVPYLAYYLSLILSLSLMLTLITAVGWLAFFGQTGIDNDAIAILGAMVALVILGAVVYSSMFLMMSALLKRPMYMGLFYAFIWEGFIGSIPGPIQAFSIKHHIRTLGSEMVNHGSLKEFASESTDAGLILATITIACLILGIFIFREKEFS